MKSLTKPLSMLAAIFVVLVSTAMVPALADRPTEFSFGPLVFNDSDPCTGEPFEASLFYDVFIHEGHPNNRVVRVLLSSGFTDTGFEAVNGHEVFINNGNVIMQQIKDVWRHDDGRMFRTKGTFVINLRQGEAKVFGIELLCISE